MFSVSVLVFISNVKRLREGICTKCAPGKLFKIQPQTRVNRFILLSLRGPYLFFVNKMSNGMVHVSSYIYCLLLSSESWLCKCIKSTKHESILSVSLSFRTPLNTWTLLCSCEWLFVLAWCFRDILLLLRPTLTPKMHLLCPKWNSQH